MKNFNSRFCALIYIVSSILISHGITYAKSHNQQECDPGSEPLPGGNCLNNSQTSIEEKPLTVTRQPESPDAVTANEQSTSNRNLANQHAPQPELITFDESLHSCVKIDRPSHTSGIDRKNSPIQIEADSIQKTEKNGETILSGNVHITRGDQFLQSEKVILDDIANSVKTYGNTIYTDNRIQMQSEQAYLDFDKDENHFSKGDFVTFDHYSRGTATQAKTLQGTMTELHNASYTTCPPGNTAAWQLEAKRINLDDTTGRGKARWAKLKLFNTPIMYLPYMGFPIDERRYTGFLTPSFNRSDHLGTELSTPMYWNIAPDRDATFYPRYMDKQGLQLGSEYRYLNKTSHGQAIVEYLDGNDRYSENSGTSRWSTYFQHTGTIFDDWSISTKINRVSDKQYFEDLGDSLSASSTTHLLNNLSLSKNSDNGSFSGLIQGFQTVDSNITDANKPYRYLPSLKYHYRHHLFTKHLTTEIEASYTRFSHEDRTKVTGKRASIYPSISYNYDQGGYYIRPKMGIHHTDYSLANQGAASSSPSRTIPIFSIDSKWFYEKNTYLFGKPMLQTLEPHIYYLNIPEKEQSDIPVFDSGSFAFNSSALFRENRFTGLDRVGDANQLSIGVSSHFLNTDDYHKAFSITLGQIYYFDDRDVILPGGAPDNDSTSPFIAQLHYSPYRELATNALIHWDPGTGSMEHKTYQLKYQPQDNKTLNLAYRFRKDSLEHANVSMLWPMNKRWYAIGHWNYTLRDNRTLEAIAGIEYESCCWKTRVVARRWANNASSDYKNGIYFELELKSLNRFGDDITKLLKDKLPGL